jgi:hypothetical protein
MNTPASINQLIEISSKQQKGGNNDSFNPNTPTFQDIGRLIRLHSFFRHGSYKYISSTPGQRNFKGIILYSTLRFI